MCYRSEPAKIPLTRDLRALGITPEAVLAFQLQRQTEPTVPQRQTESETQSELDMPPESQQSSKLPESIKITRPDIFDGKDTFIAVVTAWAFSVEEYMELTEVPEDKQTHLAGTLL